MRRLCLSAPLLALAVLPVSDFPAAPPLVRAPVTPAEDGPHAQRRTLPVRRSRRCASISRSPRTSSRALCP